ARRAQPPPGERRRAARGPCIPGRRPRHSSRSVRGARGDVMSAAASNGTSPGPKLSIHVGLTRVDPNAYQGWAGWLGAPGRAGRDMAALAEANGYEPLAAPSGALAFVNEEATWGKLTAAVKAAKDSLTGKNATLLLTFSGHGGEAWRSTGEAID